MKKICFSFIVLAISCLIGCGTTFQYKGNDFPPLSSPAFPSFGPISEISDGIKFKLALGNGKYRGSFGFLVYDSSKPETLDRERSNPLKIKMVMDMNFDWDISYDKNQFIYKIEVKIGNISSNLPVSNDEIKNKLKTKIKIQSIHDSDGKTMKLEGWLDDEQVDINDKKFEGFKEVLEDLNSAGFSPFTTLGKIVKTGDVLRYYSPKEFSSKGNIFGNKSQVKMPEIIKGRGVYRNKEVIVSESMFDGRVHNPDNPELIIEMRMKGYNLYDSETFIPQYSKMSGYLNGFSPTEGIKMSGEVNGFSAYDIHVNKYRDNFLSQKTFLTGINQYFGDRIAPGKG